MNGLNGFNTPDEEEQEVNRRADGYYEDNCAKPDISIVISSLRRRLDAMANCLDDSRVKLKERQLQGISSTIEDMLTKAIKSQEMDERALREAIQRLEKL